MNEAVEGVGWPLVSVVMAVHNCGRFLEEAVESILSQTYSNLELIVIDDASEDEGPAYLASVSDERLILRTNATNKGVAFALNRGIAEARGKYIARMDGDDISLPIRLERQVAFLEANPQIAVVGSFIENIDSSGSSLGTTKYPINDQAIRRALSTGAPFAHPATLIRHSVFSEVGGYRAQFKCAEDYDLWLRISEKYLMSNLDETLLKYRNHPNSASVKSAYHVRLGVLVAQISAEFRMSGRIDPLCFNTILSDADLDALGITHTRRQTMALLAEIDRSKRLMAIGELTEAKSILDNVDKETLYQNELYPELVLLDARLIHRLHGFLPSVLSLAVPLLRSRRVITVAIEKAIRAISRRFRR